MAVKIFDTMTTATPNFPLAYAEKINVVKSDGTEDNLQNLFNAGELGGGDSSIVLSQAEYDALSDEEKMSDQEYQCYDTGRIYKLGVVYGDKKPVTLTFEEYKALEEAGSVEADVDYIIVGNESGSLLSDLDIEHGTTGTTAYEAIETLKSDVENLIDDTNLTSTTSTLSANKIKSAVVHSFNTQDGKVKYLKLKLDVNTISVVDIYGGKIEILGANNSSANPSYKTAKVVRHSYGDWGSYDATQAPSALSAKIGSLYYYPTDNYYYLQLNNYAHFIVAGALTKPETVTDLPVETSEMTLIPESSWGRINDSATGTNSTWSSSKIASEIGAKITKTQYRGSRSIDISTGGKLTLICSSEYASQAGCYMLLSNFNTEPLLIELGRNNIGQFSVTATHKSQNVDTITVTVAGDEYSWFVLQF